MFGASRYRLAFVVSLLLLAGFLLNSISSYYVSRENVRKTITESSLPLTSDNIYSVIQRDLLQPIFISSMMANDAFLRDWTIKGEHDVAQMKRYLDEIRREYDTVTSFFVSEATQNYYYWGGILKKVSPDAERDVWYYRVRDMEKPFEINVDVDMANHDALTIFVNYRVYDYDHRFIGAAGTGLTVNRVNSLIQDYEARFGREIFFVDHQGNIVLSPADSRLRAFGKLQSVPGLDNYVERLIGTQTEQKLEYARDGKTYFLNSRYIPELNWFLMVEQSEDQLLMPFRHALWLNIFLALLVTAVVAALCISAISMHQKKLASRNAELAERNAEVIAQKRELEKSKRGLEEANTALKALNREKDEFLGIVAHDLRSPLGGILGLADLVDQELAPGQEPLHEHMAEIRRTGFQMMEMIGEILNLSSIESFHGSVELEPCNWNQLVIDACAQFESRAKAKGIRIATRLDAAAETEVPTRGKWVTISLNNLVSNAIKYSSPGAHVWVETAHTKEGEFEIRVRDEGPGIPPSEVGELFKKFRPLSTRPTSGESSSGLGLYIAQKMCQRLGGRVTVETEPGEGSCFTIHHPPHNTHRL